MAKEQPEKGRETLIDLLKLVGVDNAERGLMRFDYLLARGSFSMRNALRKAVASVVPWLIVAAYSAVVVALKVRSERRAGALPAPRSRAD